MEVCFSIPFYNPCFSARRCCKECAKNDQILFARIFVHACEVSELRIKLAALVKSLQSLGVVAEELSVDLGLLGQHLEVVANLVLGIVPVHLLLEVVMEVVMELMKLRDLEKDHLTVNFEKQKLLIEGKSYSKRTYLDLLLLII